MYRILPKNINLIVACQRKDWGIGFGGKIPWRAPTDMSHFKRITSETKNPDLCNAIVMGSTTCDNIGKTFPNRLNYVVTRNTGLLSFSDKNLFYRSSLYDAFKDSMENSSVEQIFVIGGANVYSQVLTTWQHLIDTIYLTLVDTEHPCDQFVSKDLVEKNHTIVSSREHTERDGTKLTFLELRAKNVGENEYMNLVRRVLNRGIVRHNRTGTDAISVFGEKIEIDISNRIPFITTKRFAWRTMLRELLWFISGDTNNKTLQAKNVHIWDGNSSREFLDSRGLTGREEGDIGPCYGFQWRHFGAEYTDCHADYTNSGVDQLQQVINLIKNDPDSRRIVMSAWNPVAQPLMALPPCHILAQWYVRDGKFLDCQLYQRSADIAVGIPFNIASYSVLTYMIAHICDLQPGKFIQVLGDAHIYTNHVDPLKEQMDRIPYTFPRLRFSRKVSNIEDFTEQDFIIDHYKHHPSIKMGMIV